MGGQSGDVAVQDDDVVGRERGVIESVAAVEGDVDGHAGPAKAGGDGHGELGVVLDYEHSHRQSSYHPERRGGHRPWASYLVQGCPRECCKTVTALRWRNIASRTTGPSAHHPVEGPTMRWIPVARSLHGKQPPDRQYRPRRGRVAFALAALASIAFMVGACGSGSGSRSSATTGGATSGPGGGDPPGAGAGSGSQSGNTPTRRPNRGLAPGR